ncbi:carbon-nitrogen hydrolase family protein [Diaminobutyricibacter sp. McL0618]|uniref:carbon-nitrogen hydrolase family protein n=1 Tax=Leifsonia sp. McL0618 TaxID=3415677 RepID=UPI003CF9AAEE
MRLALAQIDSGTDKLRNLELIAHRARAASDAGADLVVFPEFSMYEKKVVDSTFSNAAEPLDGPFVDGLRALAVDGGLTIVAGVVEQAEGDERPFNTLVAIGPSGTIDARYRKVHLFDSFGFRESDSIRPSDTLEPVVLDVDGVTVGLMACYDLRFPELARELANAGAELMLACSSWVPGTGKIDQWRVLAQARAIENVCFFAGVSQLPPISIGHSLLVDPMGGVIGSLGTEPNVKTFDVDASVVATARAVNTALGQRRYSTRPAPMLHSF